MRIVIDMQGAQTEFSRHRGVGRYTIGLVQALLRIGSSHEIILALNGYFDESIESIRSNFHELLPQSNIRVWHQEYNFSASNPSSFPKQDAAELVREFFINSLKPDVIFSTNLQEGLSEAAVTTVRKIPTSALVCTTLHDAIPLIRPDHYLKDPVTRKWYEGKIDDVNKSDIILTVSESSKTEIIKYTGIDPKRIHVVPNAVDSERFYIRNYEESEILSIRKKFSIVGKFVLYAGGNDEHKNLSRLFEAYAKLPRVYRDSYQLVLVGRELGIEEPLIRVKLRKHGIDNSVVFTGRIEDEELTALLNLTNLFVFPSTHEGFGLPPLEAMACGAPVIASSAPSIAEVIGNPSALFDPYDVEGMAEKLERALSDSEFSAKLVKEGVKRTAAFSWDASARILLSVLEANLLSRAEKLSNEGRIHVDNPSDKDTANPAVFVHGDVIESCITRIAASEHSVELSDDDLCNIAASLATTFPPDSRKDKQIFLDVSTLVVHDHKTGIQRVVRAICSELLKREQVGYTVRLVHTSPNEKNFFSASILEEEWGGNGLEVHEGPVEFFCGDILVFIDLHPSVAISHVSEIRSLRNRGVRVLHVVYDLLPALHRSFFWPELCDEFEQWLEAISHSDGAICISKAVAYELAEWQESHVLRRSRPFEVRWFHLGADLVSSVPSSGLPEGSDTVLRQLANRVTFLMVGTIEPRKGHALVLSAFETLWSVGVDVNLVVVGKQGWKIDELTDRMRSHNESNRRLFWLEGISDEFLERVYGTATALIAASEGEGFGLPLIEAAQHGLPIIARDIPVFHEVAGEHAFYFESKTAQGLANEIVTWIEMRRSNEIPLSTGMHYLTWRESAENFFQCCIAT